MPNQEQVDGTLWLLLVIGVAASVTVATEAVYRIFDSSDPLIASLDDLLLPVQQVTESIASLHTPSKAVRDRIVQYQMVGTGRLRMMLQRAGLDPTRRAQRTAVIAIAGRLIGLAANLMRTPTEPGEDDAVRLRAVSKRLGVIRAELCESGAVSASAPALEGPASPTFPMLQELEQTVAIILEVFLGDEIVQNAPRRGWWRALFVPDAFQNPEYLRFAFAGCLSASVCYILYNGLDWPGINTRSLLALLLR